MPKHIAVIGAGDTGRDIARSASSKGIGVFLYDVNDTILRHTIEVIREDLQKLVKKGLMTNDEQKEIIGRIRTKTELKALGTSDIVIETAHNDIRVKKDLFRKLESICRLNTILAAHTSTISINAIASSCQLRHKIIGVHFLPPAYANPMVEIVRGAETSDATVKAVADLAAAMQKKAVFVRDVPGLIADRINCTAFHEALCMLDENITGPEELDRIIKLGGGFLDGPLNIMDQNGLDTELALSEAMETETSRDPRFRPHPLLKRMVASGNLGVKSGQGFFKHASKFKV